MRSDEISLVQMCESQGQESLVHVTWDPCALVSMLI